MLARIRKSAEGKDQGFTLVELLVVMIIIGILAAVAIPVFLNQRQKAVDTSIKSDLRSAAQYVETQFVDTQEYAAGATWGTITAAQAPGFRASSDNEIQYKATGNAFCLRGSNDDSNASSSALAFYYASASGGLQPGAPLAATATVPAAC